MWNVVRPAVDRSAVNVVSSALVNSTAVLECPVTGTPTPRVVWMKDGRPVDPGRSANVELVDGGRRLVLHAVSLTDTGTYRCVAANRAGRDSVDIAFDVHGTATFHTSSFLVANVTGSRQLVSGDLLATCRAYSQHVMGNLATSWQQVFNVVRKNYLTKQLHK